MLAHPIGLTNAAVIYQSAKQDQFTDQIRHGDIDDLTKSDLPKADQVPLMVNMVAIHKLPDESLHTILEETLNSEGSTKTDVSFPPCSTYLWW